MIHSLNDMGDKPEIGDLVMHLNGDLGAISHTENVKGKELYFVLWFNGYLQGYSTAHEFREVELMRMNIKLFSLTNETDLVTLQT